MTGTLDEMQMVAVAPGLDVLLADEIQRTDQLHAVIVGARHLRQHGLPLTGIKHAHECGFDDIVEMVSERDLIAAELLRLLVQMTAAHPGAEIAGGGADVVHRIEDVRLEKGERNPQKRRIALDDPPVGLVVSRIHAQEREVKAELAVLPELLKELGHDHGILAAGDADGNAVAVLNQIVFEDGPGKGIEEILMKAALLKRELNLRAKGLVLRLFADGVECPGAVSAGKALGGKALCLQLLRQLSGDGAVFAIEDNAFAGSKRRQRAPVGIAAHLLRGEQDTARDKAVLVFLLLPGVHQKISLWRERVQLGGGELKRERLTGACFIRESAAGGDRVHFRRHANHSLWLRQ